MKKRFQLILLLLFISSKIVVAQQGQKSLLWEISGNGLQQPSYLYGTIHLICSEDIQLTNAAQNAFVKSSELYLELDLDDPILLSNLKQKTTSQQDLKSLLSKKRYEKLSSYFVTELGFSIEILGKIKPFYLLSYTYKALVGCENPISIESVLVAMARAEAKPINGLETLEQQTTIFEKIPQKRQAHILAKQIQRKKEQKTTFRKLLSLYKNSDIEALLKATKKSPTRKLNKLLLKKRNEDWLTKIPKIAERQTTFFAVGAAHLGGKNGLVQLLQKKGFTVKAI
jgi:uncharacterized protein